MKNKIRIQGLRKRWLINSIGPILLVAILGVVVFSIGIANYYYTGMRAGLETRAKESTEVFNTYGMSNYSEFYQMAYSYTEDFKDKYYLVLKFINSGGMILISTYGVTAVLTQDKREIAKEL